MCSPSRDQLSQCDTHGMSTRVESALAVPAAAAAASTPDLQIH